MTPLRARLLLDLYYALRAMRDDPQEGDDWLALPSRVRHAVMAIEDDER